MYSRPEGVPAEYMPSNRPDRQEVVSMICVGPGQTSMHIAPILRMPGLAPTLAPWNDYDDNQFDEPHLGQLGIPLRDAVRTVMEAQR